METKVNTENEVKTNFEKGYDMIPAKYQIQVRNHIMGECGWRSILTFHHKRKGIVKIRLQETADRHVWQILYCRIVSGSGCQTGRCSALFILQYGYSQDLRDYFHQSFQHSGTITFMKLSCREYDVARLIAWGASDKEVAEELYISVHTAHTHRRNILRKIGGRNTADITRYFLSKEYGVCFGLNPRQIRHIAFGLLLLVCVNEFIDNELLRVRRTRLPEAKEKPIRPSRPSRTRARTGRSLKLEFA
jgi:DNA-binding CsgD family transcriptional regulator